ncbi:MAG: protein O-GlcNAc transferase [Pyrinomonadaceae bacterium]|nr:protein O-GlcNAc transferase [Pyrinomonadaceae bacterium]
MNWTSTQIITTAVSVCALVLGIANFIHTRILARKDLARRIRDDRLNIDHLLDSTFELLYGKEGFENTKDSKKLRDAEVCVERALMIDPNYPRGIEYEGHLFEVQGNEKAAIARYKKSISLDPSRARPHNCLGLIKNNEDSIGHFKKAIELDPERAALPYYNLGKAYKRLRNLKEAENNLRAAIELRPKYQYAYYELGELLRESGRYAEARTAYEQAIAADSSYINTMVALGRMLMENNKEDDEGISWIEQAMKINPTDDYPLAMLAAIYADRKDPDKALSYAKRAIALNPTRRFQSDVFADLTKEMNQLLERHSKKEES